MLEIGIENFQIIDEAEIELDNLIAIKGNNDSGKSSIARGLNAIIQNLGGDGHIKNGEDSCSVSIKHNDVEFEWVSPRDGGASYYIDGEEYDKIGRGSFEKIMDLGYSPIETNGGDFYLQFWNQKEPFLLCNRPATRKFEILSNLFDREKFKKIIQDIKGDKKQIREDIKDNESKLEQLEDQVEDKKAKRDCYEPISKIELDAIEENVEKFNNLEELQSDYRQAIKLVDKIDLKLKSISEPEFDIDLGEKLDKLSRLRELYETLSTTNRRLEKLERVADTEVQLKLDSDKVDILTRLKELSGQLTDASELIDRLSGISNEGVEIKVDRDRVERVDRLKKIRDNYKQVIDKVDELENREAELGDELEEVEADKEKLESELGKCPLCGSEFS